ncbi:MAG TPA: 5-formyltetrahydrofolate cyclo-ligase [Gammaproteobacteria bacterium]|nr:5-formyltetrahydrofolate cyclo-ligase [Gammaproteobacteria bacterium]
MKPLISTKAEWRKKLLARRQNMSSSDQKRAANEAAHILQETAFFKRAQHIACYYPIQHEFDCLPLIELIWRAQKKCYLPVLSDDSLDFFLYEKNTTLQPNRYQIPEPVTDKKIALDQLDIVLLPLVGFDETGNRLGMGAGYYDRTFHQNTALKKPFLLGLGYEVQQVSELPKAVWDVPLDGVLTEKNMRTFRDAI